MISKYVYQIVEHNPHQQISKNVACESSSDGILEIPEVGLCLKAKSNCYDYGYKSDHGEIEDKPLQGIESKDPGSHTSEDKSHCPTLLEKLIVEDQTLRRELLKVLLLNSLQIIVYEVGFLQLVWRYI